MLDNYKIIKPVIEGATIKNPYYVMQLCYINKKNEGKYRLVKQCSTIEKAQEYVQEHSK